MTESEFTNMERRVALSKERSLERGRFLNKTANQINYPQTGEIIKLESRSAANAASAQNSPGLRLPKLSNEFPCFSIVIRGQIVGGKNNIIITRTGKRFPKASWAKWRDEAVRIVKAQLPKDWKPISVPTNIRLEYVAGDKRRRDQPAIIDSTYHVLERSGFVADDCLLWITESTRTYDPENPHVVITVLS